MAEFVPRTIEEIQAQHNKKVQAIHHAAKVEAEKRAKKVADIAAIEAIPVEPVAAPVAESVVTAITAPAAEPVVEPATSPVTEPVAKPAIDQIVEPVVAPVSEPPVETKAESVASGAGVDSDDGWIDVDEPIATDTLSLDEINDQFIEEISSDGPIESEPAVAVDEAEAIAPVAIPTQPVEVEETPEKTAEEEAVEVAKVDEVHAAPAEIESAETEKFVAIDPAAQVAAFDALEDARPQDTGLRKIFRALGTLLWIVTVLGLILTLFGYLTRDNPVTKFGDFGVFYQRTNDMEPAVGVGSLVITRLMDGDEGLISDDIVFQLDPTGAEKSAALRRVVNVLRANNMTTYDTIALANRENTHEQFVGGQALARKVAAIPLLGFIIDWLTINLWWTIGAFVLSLIMVMAARRRERD